MTPSTPAPCARSANAVVPIASVGFRSPISTSGVIASSSRNAATTVRTSSRPTPWASARSDARWITGPSAIGSENGTPSSITSAPAEVSARISGTVAASEGSPAVMYGISAARPAARSLSKVASMRFIGPESHYGDARAPKPSRSFFLCLAGLVVDRDSSPCRVALGPAVKLESRALGDGIHVLVAAPGKIDQQHRAHRQFRCDSYRIGKRMRRFERGNDALDAAAIAKRAERLIVGDRHILRASVVLEPRMLRPDAGIVEPRRHRVGLDDLPVLVLQQVGAIAVQHAGRTCGKGRRVTSGSDALARCLHADQLDALVREIGIKDAHRVRAAADAGDDHVRLAADHFRHLLQALATDHALEIANHHRVGMRSRDRPDDVERILDVGHPVAHRFVERVLERLRAGFDRNHLSPEQLHPEYVLRLALDVFRSHLHDALHAEARSHGRGGNAVLAGARLGDHSRLAESFRQQRLADAIVYLVRTGVIQILALEIDLRAAELFGPALRVIDRARPADIMLELRFEFSDEGGIVLIARVLVAKLVERRDKRLGDEHAAVGAEVSARIRQVIHLHCVPPG